MVVVVAHLVRDGLGERVLVRVELRPGRGHGFEEPGAVHVGEGRRNPRVRVDGVEQVHQDAGKAGKGDELFALTTDLHHTGDPDGPVDWVLSRVEGEPDTLWAFELYGDEDSFTRHCADPALDEGHRRVFDLLAGMPFRTKVHVVASS